MTRFLTGLCLTLGLAFSQSPALAVETYDLIFKNGTLDDISKDATLAYDRETVVDQKAEMSDRATGEVRLTFEEDEMARLRFHQGDKLRNIGAFPATVGNPIIMYFVETVIRDVAQEAGGSPFYIRNRVKDSLIQFAEINDASKPFGGSDVGVQQITLRPFLNDPNRAKMKGYEDLALTITMSNDVPGWYYSLEANVTGKGGQGPLYRNALTLLSGTAE